LFTIKPIQCLLALLLDGEDGGLVVLGLARLKKRLLYYHACALDVASGEDVRQFELVLGFVAHHQLRFGAHNSLRT